jgi:hypothetical protein
MLCPIPDQANIPSTLNFSLFVNSSQYGQLIPWLCIALLPLFYLMTSSKPPASIGIHPVLVLGDGMPARKHPPGLARDG